MKNPVKAAAGCAVCSVDTAAGGCRIFCLCLRAGCGAGSVVRLSAAAAPEVDNLGRQLACAGQYLGFSGVEFWHLSGGYPSGLYSGAGRGRDLLRQKFRAAVAARFFRILEANRGYLAYFDPPDEKIFRNFEKTGCICEKMGYNKMEQPSAKPT